MASDERMLWDAIDKRSRQDFRRMAVLSEYGWPRQPFSALRIALVRTKIAVRDTRVAPLGSDGEGWVVRQILSLAPPPANSRPSSRIALSHSAPSAHASRLSCRGLGLTWARQPRVGCNIQMAPLVIGALMPCRRTVPPTFDSRHDAVEPSSRSVQDSRHGCRACLGRRLLRRAPTHDITACASMVLPR